MKYVPFEKIIRLKGRIIFLCLLALLSLSSRAQQYYFDQYSVSEGLAQSTVYCIIQDQNDVFWLGTQAGVSKFDGIEIINLTAEDGLADGAVRTIFEDSHGSIWFGHNGGGITRYSNNAFNIYDAGTLYLKSDITSINQDDEGSVWITTAGSGAARILNPEASPLSELKYEQFLGGRLSDRVYGNYFTDSGEEYFVTDHAVKIFNSDSLKFENLTMNGVPRYFTTSCFLKDKNGASWFGTHNGGLYRYDPEIDDTEMYDLIKMGMTTNFVSTLFEDSQGNLWAGTWGGGMARISQDGSFKVFNTENGLPGNKIRQITEDKEGNILIGTHEHGLCAFKGDLFVSYNMDDGLIGLHVWAIEQTASDTYWLGTSKGISILTEGANGSKIRNLERFKNEDIRYLSQDQNGSVWIGIEEQGLFQYLPSGEVIYPYRINNNIMFGSITGIAVDNDNNLWVGALEGLIYYEIDNEQMNMVSQLDGLVGSEVSAVFADSKGRIWVGSPENGITIIDGTEFIIPELEMHFTPRCFVEDKDGLIWIGTLGRGLLAYDPEQEKIVKHLTVLDGLLANLINLLNCDEQNNIYIGTNKGLNKYLQSEDRLIAFNAKSGFFGIETKPNATCLDRNGSIWFGTVRGATRYDPSIQTKNRIPLTHITGLKVNYEPYPLGKEIVLSHRQNSLIFDYRCITLNPEAVQYKIMLEGIDIDWRPPGQLRQVTYPALPPGKYTFMVKATTGDGIWNDPPVSLSFQIKPPFYLTWYFILSVIFAIGALILSYIKIRERALRRQNRILQEKVTARTAEVVAQKEELAQKNKDITDSIRYAKRIQFAILPPSSPFSDTFILFKPKDIVSGDFYWFAEVEGKEFIAAVDCTGHGVPGALMSMIGHSALNKIVNQYNVLDPGQILTKLNGEVVDTLHHQREQTDVHDGMDLALIAFDKEKSIVEYAGAYNPMYLIRDGELFVTKADKQPIGRTEGIQMRDFTTNRVEVQKGDMIYLFSDGYADQFGGESQKKFKPKNMRELMISISDKSINKQRDILDEAIEKWRGNVEQIDDILIIGRRF